jgi:hypothetical protein
VAETATLVLCRNAWDTLPGPNFSGCGPAAYFPVKVAGRLASRRVALTFPRE